MLMLLLLCFCLNINGCFEKKYNNNHKALGALSVSTRRNVAGNDEGIGINENQYTFRVNGETLIVSDFPISDQEKNRALRSRMSVAERLVDGFNETVNATLNFIFGAIRGFTNFLY